MGRPDTERFAVPSPCRPDTSLRNPQRGTAVGYISVFLCWMLSSSPANSVLCILVDVSSEGGAL